MLSFDINWWAVIVAAVINMVVGAIWYSPALFGKNWSRLVGKKMEDMRANARTGYSLTTLSALAMAYLLANIVRDIGIATGRNGLLLGLILWLGFVAATSVSDTVFAGRPWKLWQINTGYYLVVLLINAWLITVWQ